MPETKNKTLEEIDILFSTPTSELMRQNFKSVIGTISDLFHLRWRKVFSPSAGRDLLMAHDDSTVRPLPEKV
jgi:hypothetical protein